MGGAVFPPCYFLGPNYGGGNEDSGESESEVAQSIQLLATSGTVVRQAPPSMGFPRQEYWSRLPFPTLGDLPDPGIQPGLPHCRQNLYYLSHQGIVLPFKKSG